MELDKNNPFSEVGNYIPQEITVQQANKVWQQIQINLPANQPVKTVAISFYPLAWAASFLVVVALGVWLFAPQASLPTAKTTTPTNEVITAVAPKKVIQISTVASKQKKAAKKPALEQKNTLLVQAAAVPAKTPPIIEIAKETITVVPTEPQEVNQQMVITPTPKARRRVVHIDDVQQPDFSLKELEKQAAQSAKLQLPLKKKYSEYEHLSSPKKMQQLLQGEHTSTQPFIANN